MKFLLKNQVVKIDTIVQVEEDLFLVSFDNGSKQGYLSRKDIILPAFTLLEEVL